MRIAIVAESFLPNTNGVTNSVCRVVEHLERTGHQATILAPGTGQSRYRHADVHPFPTVQVPRINSLPIGLPQPKMTQILRDFDPDVVHLASPFLLGAGGLAAALRLDVPAVAVFQTDVAGFAASYGLGVTSRAAWAWTKRLHRRAARTLAPSIAAVEALNRHGIPNVYRWARGVDTTRFDPRHRTRATNDFVVGYVGRLAPEKHVERLACLDRDTNLVIVGDGPERRRLETKLPNATFTGELHGADLARAYADLDVFVHAGEHETFCQAVQEALASGVPVIAPDAGGPRDLVAHCRNGYLLPVERFEELLPSAVAALKDPDLRERFGRAARRSVHRRTWPVICDELLDHYADVLGVESDGRRMSA